MADPKTVADLSRSIVLLDSDQAVVEKKGKGPLSSRYNASFPVQCHRQRWYSARKKGSCAQQVAILGLTQQLNTIPSSSNRQLRSLSRWSPRIGL